MRRIRNAMVLFIMAIKNPELVNIGFIENMTSLYGFLDNVVKQGYPQMCRIGASLPNGDKSELISIWACPSASGDPYDRISELHKQINFLKGEIAKIQNN